MKTTTKIMAVLGLLALCSIGLADELLVPAEYPTIQAAIDVAVDGDEVIVAPGTYTGPDNRDIDFLGKAITVRSADPNDPNVAAATIIDCNGTYSEPHRGFYFHTGEGPNSVLAGLTITNGYGSEESYEPEGFGGAIFCDNSSPTITNCIISGNKASWSGGGIYCYHGNPKITNCIISGNTTSWVSGGGIFCLSGNPTIINCNITGNSGDSGGGIYCGGGNPTITNCIVSGNTAWWDGGAIYCYRSNPIITNCTVCGNTAHLDGDGIYCYDSSPKITNCIIWDNRPEQIYGSPTVTYSNVQGGWPGQGNINTDPGFAFFDAYSSYNDFHLMRSSPCIDAGTNTPVGGLPATDLDGTSRPLDGDTDGLAVADMGAYEHNEQLPRIAINSDTFDFAGPSGGPNPPNQNLLLRNAGGGILSWRIDFECSWLQVHPLEGTSNGEIREIDLAVDALVLSPGEYSTTLVISDPQADNTPLKFVVTLMVGLQRHVPSEYPTIQAAIDDCNDEGDGVIISPGTYTGLGNRDIDFLGKTITVCSTNPNDPNIIAVTIIDCNGTETDMHRGFRFHKGEGAKSVLAGVTITNGYAQEGGGIYCYKSSPTITNCTITGNLANYDGGGIYCDKSSPTITGCIIAGNTVGEDGGGIYKGSGAKTTMTITNCVFTNNTAGSCGGGISIYSRMTGDAKTIIMTVTNCTFTNNKAGAGGGIGNNASETAATVTNCTFTNNEAKGNGGGIYNGTAATSMIVTNCLFTNNTAHIGGGMCNYDDSKTTIIDCLFTNNTAAGSGGGMYNRSGTGDDKITTIVTNCTFTNNEAKGNGGGIYNHASTGDAITTTTVTNSLFTNNTVGGNGGGMYNGGGTGDAKTIAFVTNCTFSGNTAGSGGGMYNQQGISWSITEVTATNCIIWDNFPQQIVDIDDTTSVIYSNVQGGWPGEGNINAEPYFAFSADCHLMPDSPCIDAGDPNYAAEPNETDLDGNPRIISERVDMGAYEYNPNSPSIAVSAVSFYFYFIQDWPKPGPQTLYIRNCGSGTLSWQAIEDCNWLDVNPASGLTNDEIEQVTLTVDPTFLCIGDHSCILGICSQNASNSPRNIVVTLHVYTELLHVPSDVPTIQDAIDHVADGGTVIVADGTYTGEGNWDIDFLGKAITVRSESGPNNCIIDCNDTEGYSHQGFCFYSGEDANSVLSGFTITNSYGAINCYNSSPIITNCIISGNTAGGGGGGICCDEDSSPTITNCIISGNAARWDGGAIYCYYNSSPTITNCIISGNTADGTGGGIYCYRSSPEITNCIISGNTAQWDGGGICCVGVRPTITNCTITGNTAGEYGGGIYCEYGSPMITNSVLWGNTAGMDGDQIALYPSKLTISYCDVEGGLAAVYTCLDCSVIWGLGNIDADPCFVEPGYWANANDPNIIVEPNDPNAVWVDGDYHLKSEGWSWDIERSRWTYDDVTSRCIDAGNPGSPLGDELLFVPDDPNNEWGQNLRINMGAFGGTAEASMPPYDWAILGDLTNDGLINLKDYALQAADWFNSADQQPGDLNRDSLIDIDDLVLLIEDWLRQTTWHE